MGFLPIGDHHKFNVTQLEDYYICVNVQNVAKLWFAASFDDDEDTRKSVTADYVGGYRTAFRGCLPELARTLVQALLTYYVNNVGADGAVVKYKPGYLVALENLVGYTSQCEAVLLTLCGQLDNFHGTAFFTQYPEPGNRTVLRWLGDAFTSLCIRNCA